jgi:hypothetical protein
MQNMLHILLKSKAEPVKATDCYEAQHQMIPKHRGITHFLSKRPSTLTGTEIRNARLKLKSKMPLKYSTFIRGRPF